MIGRNSRARASSTLDRGPSSTDAVQSRLKSSSTQRDAKGSARSKRWYAATLANTSESLPRVGRNPSRNNWSSAMAPQTSLPCVSAWISTCGPGSRGDMGPDIGNTRVARCVRGEIRKRHLDGRDRALRTAHASMRRHTRAWLTARVRRAHAAQTWSARRRMNVSQRASCSSETHSLGWCACSMCPGPQMIVEMSALWNKRRLGAERHLAEVVRATADLAEFGDLAAAVRVEPGHGRKLVELDIGRGTDGVHVRQQCRGKALDLGQQCVRIVEGQVPEFEIEGAVARHDVERRAAVDHTGMDRRVGHVVGGIEAAPIAKPASHVRQERDDFAGDLHRVHPSRGQRGMRLMAAHAAAVAFLALVRDHQMHARRLADDASRRLDAARGHVRDQAPDADATHFFVVRKREMQRTLQSAAQEFRHERQRCRRKALHVGGAAAVQPVADQRRLNGGVSHGWPSTGTTSV